MLRCFTFILFFCALLPLFVNAELSCSSSNMTGSLQTKDWRYATDPHGSSAKTKGNLFDGENIWISFSRLPRVDVQNNTWVELIYDLPNKHLKDETKIALTYQSTTDLLIKLSQKDYGGEGDNSYAHYQYSLPATTQWTSICVNIADFQRPNWTPESSKDVGIINKNVKALYLVPDLEDELGGHSTLEVKAIGLFP